MPLGGDYTDLKHHYKKNISISEIYDRIGNDKIICKECNIPKMATEYSINRELNAGILAGKCMDC